MAETDKQNMYREHPALLQKHTHDSTVHKQAETRGDAGAARAARCIAALEKGFQADLEVILLVPDCNPVAQQHLNIWWPESVIYRHVGIVWRPQDRVHEHLQGHRCTDRTF